MLDKVITNAHGLTQDSTNPLVHTIGISQGRIIALDGAADNLIGPGTERIDAHQATVIPGFNDAHAHSVWFGQTLTEIDLGGITRTERIYSLLRDAEPKKSGGWIVASSFNPSLLGDGPVELAKLDAACREHPLLIKHATGHSYTVNSAALKLAGIDPAFPPKAEGGQVVTDESGRATGTLDENAMRYVQDILHPESAAFITHALDLATQHYLSEGITSVTDAGVAGGWIGHSPREFGIYQTARSQGKLRTRMQPMITADCLHPLDGHAEEPAIYGLDGGIHTGLGDDWLRLGPTKMFLDGSMLGATAAMTENYCHCPHTRGYFQGDKEEMRARALGAVAGGWSLALHAIGDAAIDFGIELIAQANDRHGRPAIPHRLEHCSVIRDDQLAQLARHNIVPVPQPRFIYELGDGVRAALGDARSAHTYPGRRLVDAGLILPGSSDRPVVDGSPLKGMQSYILRTTASGHQFGDDCLSVQQALYAYTAGSAAATGQAGNKGQLAVGQLADFTILGANPLEVPAEEIGDIPVTATIIGGEVVYGGTD